MKNPFRYFKELYVLYFLLGKNQRAWLLFLKNNPDKQFKQALGEKYSDGSYRACCLGQAGLMFGYCHWKGNVLYSVNRSYPDRGDNEKFLKLINFKGSSSKGLFIPSLSEINDSGTWLNVYNACIDNPKEYFTGKI